jgi:hypothetical protein
MLLNVFHEQTKTPVRFALEDTTLDSARIYEMPFLYMTGHQEFSLSEGERAGLRQYLQRGGLLYAEACCGRAGFDRSFRKELGQILPGSDLAALPAAHPLFQSPNQIQSVQPRAALAVELNATGKIAPRLLGVSMDGHLAVIYSPDGLSCGWELAECPYCKGVVPQDAIAIGVNLLQYAAVQ